MTDYTPYLRLAKPPFDDLPWDEAVNGNMDNIDAFTSVFMSIPNFAGAWKNNTEYLTGQNVLDISDGLIYTALVTYTTSPEPTTFAQERVTFPTFWIQSYPAAPATGQTYNNSGRNKLHNSQFGIWQRGYGPFTINGYTADRWQILCGLDVQSVTKFDISDVIRSAIASEVPQFGLQATIIGDPAAGSFSLLGQPVENVRKLAGRNLTLSFWAAASSALSVGINVRQDFGTGGSPSAILWTLGLGKKVTLGPAWARYSVPILVQSIQGKTIGTDLNSNSLVSIFLSGGTDYDSVTGGIGVQSGTFQFWGMQLEDGNGATPFDFEETAGNFQDCQRFFQPHVVWVPAAASEYAYIPFPTPLRATPTITGGGAGFAQLNTTIYGTNVRQTIAAAQILYVSAEY